MFKAGTVRELEQIEGMMERGVYLAALRIVSILDEVYGAGRDVEGGDGGFVLIAENIQDVSLIGERYVRLDMGRHEAVDVLNCGKRPYINAFFLSNNEFGINILMPMEIAPGALLRDLPQKVK